MLNRKYIFKGSSFHCYAFFLPECTLHYSTPAGYHVASIDLYTISNTSSSTTGMTMRSSEVNLDLDCWSKLSQGKLKLIICSLCVHHIFRNPPLAAVQVGTLCMLTLMGIKDRFSVNVHFWWCRISLISSLAQWFHNIYWPIQPWYLSAVSANGSGFQPVAISYLHAFTRPHIQPSIHSKQQT